MADGGSANPWSSSTVPFRSRSSSALAGTQTPASRVPSSALASIVSPRLASTSAAPSLRPGVTIVQAAHSTTTKAPQAITPNAKPRTPTETRGQVGIIAARTGSTGQVR